MPEELVRKYSERMQDESYLAFLDMLAFALPRAKPQKNPLLVLGGEDDTIFTVKEVTAMARRYGVTPEFFPGMAHDMMLEPDWRDVARRIVRFMEQDVGD